MIQRKVIGSKQQIVSEYLSGDQSFAALSKKYGINARTIQTWVRAFRKQHPASETQAPKTNDLKAVKKELVHAQLKIELLEEMMRLSKEQSGINLRKKSGTKQS